MAQFNEQDHPRDKNGQFAEKGTSLVSPKEEIASLREKLKNIGGSRFNQTPEQAKARKEITDRIAELEKQTIVDSNPRSKIQPKEDKTETANVTEKQQKQFDIIQSNNAMTDDYHTGIRKPSDIKTPQEAFRFEEDNYLYPDFTYEDGKRALESGKITIYSSKPIKQGGFISPSKRMAQDYAGNNGRVYSMEVSIDDVAWIDGNEGQFAKIEDEKSKAEELFGMKFIK